MHALAVRTHARVRASARRRVCVHFLSPGRLLLLFIYAGMSLICLWHSAQLSSCASRVLLTGPENRFASGRGFDTTIRRVRNEQQDLNELYSIFLQYGPLISYGSQWSTDYNHEPYSHVLTFFFFQSLSFIFCACTSSNTQCTSLQMCTLIVLVCGRIHLYTCNFSLSLYAT